jgi:hypothetical protein
MPGLRRAMCDAIWPEHLADLAAEEQRSGRSDVDAQVAALVGIGGIDDLARATLEQRQWRAPT